MPLSLLFSNPFGTSLEDVHPVMTRDLHHSASVHRPVSGTHGLSRSDSLKSKTGSLSFSRTLLLRFRQLRYNIFRPFVLAHHDKWQSMTPAIDMHRGPSSASSIPQSARSDTDLLQEKLKSATEHISHIRDPSQPTFFARVLRSDGGIGIGSEGEPLSLPFRLSVRTSHSLVERQVPYLRHSWNRIDFIAILSFWITFALASTGLENQAHRHIGIFRALSVLRTTRLLAVTAGTTVSGDLKDTCGQC